MSVSTRIGLILCLSAALFMAAESAHSQAAAQEHTVVLRGQTLGLQHYPPGGTPLNSLVLYLPGDRGLAGWAITVAQSMASWGFEVHVLDTKDYLDRFTAKAELTPADVMSDLRAVAEAMTKRSGARVTIVGWSEGAGLGVLGAAGDRKDVFRGFVAFGLSDENAIAWHWGDNLLSLVKKPREATFNASDYLSRISPLPFVMIQSSRDEYVSQDEAHRLFALVGEPKRFELVNARNHRFDDSQDEFFRTLRDGLMWVHQRGVGP